MAQLTIEERLVALETKMDFMATKADIHQLMWRLGGLIIASVSIGVAVLRFWN